MDSKLRLYFSVIFLLVYGISTYDFVRFNLLSTAQRAQRFNFQTIRFIGYLDEVIVEAF